MMRKLGLNCRQGLWTAACIMLMGGMVSCDRQASPKETPDGNRIKAEFAIYEQDPSAIGCKISANYPSDSTDATGRVIREWINEQLGGTYTGSLNDGKQLVEYYGKEQAARIRKDIEEFGENSAMGQSVYYVQFKKVFETTRFVTYTEETYQYAGGAHGSESTVGQVFRKPDGRMFGWDMFTADGKEKLRDMIKNRLKDRFFKAKSDEEFYNMLLAENARYLFPLPENAPLLRPNGVEFIYQQYEIAPYAAGMPSCTLPYDSVRNLFTVTMRPLIESTTDSIAATYLNPGQ